MIVRVSSYNNTICVQRADKGLGHSCLLLDWAQCTEKYVVLGHDVNAPLGNLISCSACNSLPDYLWLCFLDAECLIVVARRHGSRISRISMSTMLQISTPKVTEISLATTLMSNHHLTGSSRRKPA